MRKKIRNMYLTLSSFLLSYLLLCPVNVYASSTSDAVADIMNSDRFSGAISSIEWLTTRIDYWFTMVITAAGFFIISAALLKNACAGAYCANHKFWDKVAEAQRTINHAKEQTDSLHQQVTEANKTQQKAQAAVDKAYQEYQDANAKYHEANKAYTEKTQALDDANIRLHVANTEKNDQTMKLNELQQISGQFYFF